MVYLRLKDKKYFVLLLKTLTGKKQITFDIKMDSMRISSLCPPYFYLYITNSLYEISSPYGFTIDVGDLLNNIELLDTNFIVLDKAFTLVKMDAESEDEVIERYLKFNENNKENFIEAINESENISYIQIPFINPIQENYQQNDKFLTRFLIRKNLLKQFLPGNVTYSNEGCLVLRKLDGGADEILKLNVEYLEEGFLDFHCSNAWLQNIDSYIDLVSNVLFCFCEGMLHIKMLFSKHRNVYMEIQVPERMNQEK